MNEKKIWIIGAGKFGRKAVKELIAAGFPQKITIVDSNPSSIPASLPETVQVVNDDGLDFIVNHLSAGSGVEWVVPCVPFHLAYSWLLRKLEKQADAMPVPGILKETLPNPMQADRGGLYISYADFFCPDDCPEPADFCTYTGKPRLGTLFKDLGKIDIPGFRPIVVRSRQLAPGLGGIKTDDLFDVLEKLRDAKGDFLIATACRCHGVIHALSIK